MDPATLLKIITNSTWMVTKLMTEEPIEFGQKTYNVEVSEASPLGPILQLTARVLQHDSEVEFNILNGKEKRMFAVDKKSGKIILKKELDFEKQHIHNFTVSASVGKAEANAMVIVRVLDANEFAPVFPRSVYETQITEDDDRHLPKTILRVTAKDKDKGPFGRLRYSLSGDGALGQSPEPCFSINETSGAVQLLRSLDRDSPDGRSQWRLRVGATDSQNEVFTNVYVNVKDVNDNSPFFPEPIIKAAISEATPQGSFVARVRAEDKDDLTEGNNARLTYSLEKNVIDEKSGSPIFRVDPETGEISTALCCLDREKTLNYIVQVVATDGGGLKGTGTVIIEVSDVNDMPPRWSRSEWTIEIQEESSTEEILATLTVIDSDATNEFAYRVVSDIGNGWEFFRLKKRLDIAGADLLVNTRLDYEIPDYRKDFRFRAEVTDIGESGWSDKYHVGGAWITIVLVDINDNDPIFQSPKDVSLFLPEDTPVGKELAKFSAYDVDKAGKSVITYSLGTSEILDDMFSVTQNGSVVLVKPLDRESQPIYEVFVLAVDDGQPSRTSTATIRIAVEDINDNPPKISGATKFQVKENSDPQTVAQFSLNDPDDWKFMHGGPFSLFMDPTASNSTKEAIEVRFNSEAKAGHGLGTLRTLRRLDREENREILVPLIAMDAGKPPVSATLTLTVEVADENDNPMSPASKLIQVHMLQSSRWSIPLGRIYVQDPDDWDASNKKYLWKLPHPYFSLNSSVGTITMKPDARPGRYELSFAVSDPVHHQKDIEANITVNVSVITSHDLISATPITLNYHSLDLTKMDNEGLSLLDKLIQIIHSYTMQFLSAGKGASDWNVPQIMSIESVPDVVAKSRIWLSTRGNFLQHLILHKKWSLEEELGVEILEIGVQDCSESPKNHNCSGECWSRISVGEGYTLFDANSTAIVGPSLVVIQGCGCGSDQEVSNMNEAHAVKHDPMQAAKKDCISHFCLNGGRCLPGPEGFRCICPAGTLGSNCKLLKRQFGLFQNDVEDEGGGKNENLLSEEGGWAWISAIPQCPSAHISLQVLTEKENSILLYSGPLSDNFLTESEFAMPVANKANTDLLKDKINEDFIVLKLKNGKPHLSLDLGDGLVNVYLDNSYSLADNSWHRIDIIWKDQLLEIIVDLCSGKSVEDILWHQTQYVLLNSSFSANVLQSPSPLPPIALESEICRAAIKLSSTNTLLSSKRPLQLGWAEKSSSNSSGFLNSFIGCIQDLRINGKLIDLGYSILGYRSQPSCSSIKCNALQCGAHGVCRGSPEKAYCECDPGWTGYKCQYMTSSSSFSNCSFIKVALSFTPPPYATSLRLRFRTREEAGQLINIASQGGKDFLYLELFQGILCLSLRMHPFTESRLCLEKTSLSDGRWHSVLALRFGSAIFLEVDDGEMEMYNCSLGMKGRKLFEIDRQEGVHIGGIPEYMGASSIAVHNDFFNGS